jgi:C4-dicarboxylate-specific signal transduction histidine kinase
LLRKLPIRRQIIGVSIAILIPVAALIFWSANRGRLDREIEVSQEAATLAATTGGLLDQYLASIDSMASALVRSEAILSFERAQADRLLAEVFRDQPFLLNIVLTDTTGDVKGTAVPGTFAPAPSRPEFVEETVARNGPVVTDFTSEVMSGKPTVMLAFPVHAADGTVAGVLAFAINLPRLQEVFARISLPAGSVITLTDSSSRVLARTAEPERYIGRRIERTPLPPGEVPAARLLPSMDGVERFFANTAISHGNWLLSVGIPRSVAIARMLPLWRRNLLIAAIGLLLMLFLSLWLANRLSGSLGELRAAAQRIADGDLSPPQPQRVANLELAQFQDSFVRMAANLREARGALDRQVEQERKMREVLQSLQRQVVRQERLAAVGVLVSGVAHELNNPLQAILGTIELLERETDVSPHVRSEIEFVKTQSGRARDIIRNLSRFSSQQSGVPAPVDLGEVVSEVVQLRRRDLEDSSITLDFKVETARRVFANFTEIEQVTLNFVVNAQQAIESSRRVGGRIRIRAFDSGRKVRLEVADDGPGVAAEHEAKLFQPFFTTKPVGKGTGLGLSVSYGIIDSYGGSIGQYSNDWNGATFFFELPADDPANRPNANDDEAPVLQRTVPPKV